MGENRFKAKEAALAEAEKRDREWVERNFCPIINNGCRMDCVCFRGAYVSDRGAEEELRWQVIGPNCTHVAVMGSVYVEQ